MTVGNTPGKSILNRPQEAGEQLMRRETEGLDFWTMIYDSVTSDQCEVLSSF